MGQLTLITSTSSSVATIFMFSMRYYAYSYIYWRLSSLLSYERYIYIKGELRELKTKNNVIIIQTFLTLCICKQIVLKRFTEDNISSAYFI